MLFFLSQFSARVWNCSRRVRLVKILWEHVHQLCPSIALESLRWELRTQVEGSWLQTPSYIPLFCFIPLLHQNPPIKPLWFPKRWQWLHWFSKGHIVQHWASLEQKATMLMLDINEDCCPLVHWPQRFRMVMMGWNRETPPPKWSYRDLLGDRFHYCAFNNTFVAS